MVGNFPLQRQLQETRQKVYYSSNKAPRDSGRRDITVKRFDGIAGQMLNAETPKIEMEVGQTWLEVKGSLDSGASATATEGDFH